MHQLFYIFLLFSFLFILERKAINILISFVGLLISVAIMLPSFPYVQTGGYNRSIKSQSLDIWNHVGLTLHSIEGEYFSYIIILVQVSALTILFGFIIMLFPSLSHSTPIKLIPPITSTIKPIRFYSNQKISTFLDYSKINSFGILKSIPVLDLIIISLILLSLIFFFPHYFFNSVEYYRNLFYNIGSLDASVDMPINTLKDYTNQGEEIFLRKLGKSFYSEDRNILKLYILTIILLLAIISLFFLIF